MKLDIIAIGFEIHKEPVQNIPQRSIRSGRQLSNTAKQASFALIRSRTTKIMRKTWNCYSTSRLLFGPGALNEIGKVVSRLKGSRVLIIADPVIESLGFVERVLKQLVSEVLIFNQGEVEPSTNLVKQCAEQFRAFKPNVTIAIGGGSNMDLAKLTCATVVSDKDPADLLGFDQVVRAIGNLICVPTTAGTGSEASHSAVICNSETGQKAAAISHYLRPTVAVVDPELSLTCPQKLTAESGIDALSHAIESYLSSSFSILEATDSGVSPYEGNHPMGDLYAEKCMRLIGENFLKAVEEPNNLEARSGMALAATLGGLAFSNCGVALVHALEYPVGNRYECAHGAGIGIVLPEVLKFLLPVREERIAHIGRYLGVEETAEVAINEVIRLRRESGLPKCLKEVGAKHEDIQSLAESAGLLERLMVLTANRPTLEDLRSIYEASL